MVLQQWQIVTFLLTASFYANVVPGSKNVVTPDTNQSME
jgi:hypothetical protein